MWENCPLQLPVLMLKACHSHVPDVQPTHHHPTSPTPTRHHPPFQTLSTAEESEGVLRAAGG